MVVTVCRQFALCGVVFFLTSRSPASLSGSPRRFEAAEGFGELAVQALADPRPPCPRRCRYEALRNSKNGWSIHEAGMAQLDDDVGLVMKKLKDMGVDDNTIVVFTTDNGTEVFTWPDGGQTPFASEQGHGV